MADQKKNEVAEALAALAGGAVPSEGETPSGGIPSETTVFSPPAAPAPAPPPAASPPSRSQPIAKPSKSRSSNPPPPVVRSPAVRPPAKASAAKPPAARPPAARSDASPNLLPQNLALPSAFPPPARIRPANPDGSPGKARPAMPERSVDAPAPVPSSAPPPTQEVPDTLPELIEDEETIAAAPDASAFAPRLSAPKPAHAPIYANLFLRQTIIPIMLTCGVLLASIGLWSMLDHNAPLAAVGTPVEILLIVVGLVLLGLGILNALQVKQILAKASKP